MTTSLPDLLAAVPALNDPGEPFAYTVEGDTIVGRWDIVKATTLYATQVEHVDKDYRITVTFDVNAGSYDFQEHQTAATATLDGDGLRGEKSFFSGKSSSKEFSFSFGGVTKDEDGISVKPLTYSFETSRIKEPLFELLEQHGWHRKKGFLSGLFNR
jgi:hypothetical protein